MISVDENVVNLDMKTANYEDAVKELSKLLYFLPESEKKAFIDMVALKLVQL